MRREVAIGGKDAPANAMLSTLTKRYLLCSSIFLILLGCGKKGPPIPYDVTVPKAISDLEGVVIEGKVLLRWSKPAKVPDGSRKAMLREFQVLRAEDRLEKEWCEECPERLEPLDVLRLDKMDNFTLVGDRFVYQDRKIAYGHVYVYRIVSITQKGFESDPSNRAVIFWDIPPEPPRQVEGTAEDRVADLRWDRVEGVGGYRVYRRMESGEFGDVPVARVGPEEFSYRDKGLSNGVVYYYVLRTARKVGKTWLEGASSVEIALTPRDLRPPVPPQAVVAIPLAEGIELSWQRNTEPDLLGYFVYRRGWEWEEFRRLNEFPLEAPLYLDKTAILGTRYEYAVTAVDRSPDNNESVFSDPVSLMYVR